MKDQLLRLLNELYRGGGMNGKHFRQSSGYDRTETVMSTITDARALLTRCLASRIPSDLRRDIDAFLVRPHGRPRKADPVRIAVLTAQGLTVAQIAAELGCDPSAVRRAIA